MGVTARVDAAVHAVRGGGVQPATRIRQGVLSLLRDQRGQMAVELVVVMPVLLAIVVVVLDGMVYLDACARFDRVAGEVVRLHVCSPAAGEYGATAALGTIEQQIGESMGHSDRLSVSVESVGILGAGADASMSGGQDGGIALLSFIPQAHRYVCTLEFEPWPFSTGGFGVSIGALKHERSYVFDPYRPGAIL